MRGWRMPENPNWKEEIAERLTGANLPPAREAEIIDELAGHLNDEYHRLLASGMNEEEALEATLEGLHERPPLAEVIRQAEPVSIPLWRYAQISNACLRSDFALHRQSLLVVNGNTGTEIRNKPVRPPRSMSDRTMRFCGEAPRASMLFQTLLSRGARASRGNSVSPLQCRSRYVMALPRPELGSASGSTTVSRK